MFSFKMGNNFVYSKEAVLDIKGSEPGWTNPSKKFFNHLNLFNLVYRQNQLQIYTVECRCQIKNTNNSLNKNVNISKFYDHLTKIL